MSTANLSQRFTATRGNGVFAKASFEVRAGSLKDYALLSQHHYRSARPATAPRVLVLQTQAPSVRGRWSKQADDKRVVAVLVESVPQMNCKLRDQAMGHRYGQFRPGRQRSRLLVQELRCISRVIVDPQYRGLGLAVRLVKHALATAQTPFTEAIAAMGRVHPFFERAGMTAYERPPHAFDARLSDALSSLNFPLTCLAQLNQTLQRIHELPAAQEQWITRELLRWYRQTVGRSGVHSADPMDHLLAARQRLLCEPVYYLHDNRLDQ